MNEAGPIWRERLGTRHEVFDEHLDWPLPGESGKEDPLLIRDLDSKDFARRQRASECLSRTQVAYHFGIAREQIKILHLGPNQRVVGMRGRDGARIYAIITE